ncbi:hypothetical protein HMN09_01025200 [Mycena chlorophos]|uniref:Uncharacterized protein n=2 Tax=Mycena chlorophos TaxID=658473 RepID=A0A146IFT3_MYCCL|nr:hypothetical protein HMN09_01025200 [Mycena chlorophos]GAT57876.1 predicted protein [Mycena chlorophos]
MSQHSAPNSPHPGSHSAQSSDQKDEAARKEASKDLTQSWMDRLQLISVITTFFASTEAGMLQVTSPDGANTSAAAQVANSTFLAALIVHIWAAILSFLGAFFVVRYRLKEAKEEEKETGDPHAPASRSGTNFSFLRSPRNDTDVWTANPHVEAVGPFQRKPPTHLLSKIHNLCILLTFVGFFLALIGLLAFSWGQNPLSVGIVASIATAAGFVGSFWVFM